MQLISRSEISIDRLQTIFLSASITSAVQELGAGDVSLHFPKSELLYNLSIGKFKQYLSFQIMVPASSELIEKVESHLQAMNRNAHLIKVSVSNDYICFSYDLLISGGVTAESIIDCYNYSMFVGQFRNFNNVS